jgi:hypothetical protein
MIQAMHKYQDTDTSATSKYQTCMGPICLQHYTEQSVAYLIPGVCVIATSDAQTVQGYVPLYSYKAYQLLMISIMLWCKLKTTCNMHVVCIGNISMI